MGGGGQRHAPAASLPRKTRYPLYRRQGGPQGRSVWVRKTSPPTGIRSPDRPARSESLYRLTYPCLQLHHVTHRYFKVFSESIKIATLIHSTHLYYYRPTTFILFYFGGKRFTRVWIRSTLTLLHTISQVSHRRHVCKHWLQNKLLIHIVHRLYTFTICYQIPHAWPPWFTGYKLARPLCCS